ncbi:MAG: GNAT family N-acetyltransferase [Bacteroidetes bacterium]|nr:GNAT family N-acetyltransferase [Bacteroidota bacterium]
MKIEMMTPADDVGMLSKGKVIDFLYEHLDEYGDKKEHIGKALDYALNPYPMAGGFILNYLLSEEIIGSVVVNKTGMKGYIPENVLVYIAVHRDHRGKGIGKKLMNRALETASGDIALHVERDNPARFLYEKLGFQNPYLEMRYYRNGHQKKK